MIPEDWDDQLKPPAPYLQGGDNKSGRKSLSNAYQNIQIPNDCKRRRTESNAALPAYLKGGALLERIFQDAQTDVVSGNADFHVQQYKNALSKYTQAFEALSSVMDDTRSNTAALKQLAVRALTNSARCHKKLNEKASAMELAHTALKFEPGCAAALYMVGVLKLESLDDDDAGLPHGDHKIWMPEHGWVSQPLKHTQLKHKKSSLGKSNLRALALIITARPLQLQTML